jgi:hypothetical protein
MLRKTAARAAVRSACLEVDTRPSSNTISPHAAITSQAGRLAAANPDRSGPCSPAAKIAPITDTPSDCPACRPADVTPPATPACARGIPATATAAMTVFTAPYPAPKTM